MWPFKRRPADWKLVQQARAEFIVQCLRKHLPESSLWHEKRYALTQLELLAIVSIGGFYYVHTFDETAAGNASFDGFTILDDLAIRVEHIPGSRKTLKERDIEQVIFRANSEFESVLADDRQSLTSVFKRVTCTLSFHAQSEEVEEEGRSLLVTVAKQLGYQLHHVPYIINDIWLPSSDAYGMKQAAEHAGAAGEFVFDQPLAVEQVTQQIQSILQTDKSSRAPGIHGRIPGMNHVWDFHVVGRRF